MTDDLHNICDDEGSTTQEHHNGHIISSERPCEHVKLCGIGGGGGG